MARTHQGIEFVSCHYATLKQEALLHLQGPDAAAFLQGQVTCDTRKLNPATAIPGVYCTVKGRVICDFLLAALAADHLVLRMRRDIRDTSAAVLAKYIVFSKARLDAQCDRWQILGCWGPGSSGMLGDIFGAAPAAQYGVTAGEGFLLIQLDEAGQEFECYLEESVAAGFQDRLPAHATERPESEWQLLQIASGIARIEAATSGEFVPQVLNYDVTDHISFKKGCYTGQEVVARLHYRGTAKRRLYLAEIDPLQSADKVAPAAGDALYSGNNSQVVGNVINSVSSGARTRLLVTATAEAIATELQLTDTQGQALAISPVPYPLPEK